MRRTAVLLTVIALLAGLAGCTTPTQSGPQPPPAIATGKPVKGALTDPFADPGTPDFSALPVNRRPALHCLPVPAQQLADFRLWRNATNTRPHAAPPIPDESGWRILMGEGNQPGETWSLVTYPPDDYESQRFYLTDFWSARVVEGEVGSFWVGTYNKPESYMSSPSEDHWDDHMNYDPNQPTMIEWDSQRKDAGREAMAWMAHHCGENQ